MVGGSPPPVIGIGRRGEEPVGHGGGGREDEIVFHVAVGEEHDVPEQLAAAVVEQFEMECRVWGDA